MESTQKVLVVGGTGHLGGRAVGELLARGKVVRALVREGSDARSLEAKGVEVVRGDMLEMPSLRRAMEGVSLLAAARESGIERFVFTSILTCDRARDVPHFWQKKLIEDSLEESGVPFVSLRPGAFVGGVDFWARGLRKGTLTALGSPSAAWTSIGIDDVARFIALAVDAPDAIGKCIDLGWDRPVSTRATPWQCSTTSSPVTMWRTLRSREGSSERFRRWRRRLRDF